MLSIVLIYFLGKYFYDLAERYNKNAWGYAILGVVTYYVGSFIGGIIIVIFMEMSSPGAVTEMGDFLLGLMSLPAGLLAVWGLHRYLSNRFKAELKRGGLGSDILDDGFLD